MKKISLKEQAYEKLKQAILDGKFKPGQSITERELSEFLEMSRTPIRTALERLEADGFLENIPNKGPVILNISLQKLMHMLELRTAIETYNLKQFQHIQLSPHLFEQLEQLLQTQQQAIADGDTKLFTKVDHEFHFVLLEFYGNEEMLKIFTQIENQLRILTTEVLNTKKDNLTFFYEQHVAIYEAIKQEHFTQASTLLYSHLQYGKEVLL